MGTEMNQQNKKNRKADSSVKTLTGIELSAFCTQVALMLTAAIPLHEGFYLMADDSKDKAEVEMLQEIADDVELGSTLYLAMEKASIFPKYVMYMTKIGEESGNLDQVMNSLAVHYKKEDRMRKTIKEAITYPVVMVFMMLIILFILMTKVMPVFEQVFTQLGTEMSPFAKSAVSIGGFLSGTLIVILVVIIILAGILTLLGKKNIHISFVEKIKQSFLRTNKISIAMGVGRFCSAVSMMLKSGMDTSEVLSLAKSISGNSFIEDKIDMCEREYEESSSFVEALKKTGFFKGFNQQMITVGSRTGHLDTVLYDLSDSYNEEAELKISRAIAKFEPTMIAVLSVAVGLILLAVMLPLIGMMVSMG